MNQCKTIHETIVRDVLDMLNDVKNSDVGEAILNRKKNKSFRSIAAASSNLTLVFPNLVSRNTNIENASMAAKASERNAVSMLQMLFSALSITNAKDGISYLKNFHTNLKIDDKMTIDKFMGIMDDLVTEGAIIVDDQEIYNKYRNDLMNLSYYLPESVSEYGLEDYSIVKDFNSFNESVILENIYNKDNYYDKVTSSNFPGMNGGIKQDRSNFYYPDTIQAGTGTPHNPELYSVDPDYALKVFDTDQKARNAIIQKRQKDQQFKDNMDQRGKEFAYTQSQDKIRNSLEKDKFNHQTKQDDIRNSNEKEKMNLSKLQFDARQNKDKIDYLRNQLLDNDVKKCNELVPTTMIVNFISVDENGTPIQSQMVIGVKAKIYPVASTDILNRMTIKHKDKNTLLGFIKSTTREISFFRDFLFCIDKAKLDAISQSRKGSSSKLWKVLERRGIKSRFKRTIGSINDASAITTLVITQEEVEYLKKSENIDLEKPKVIRPIMESYNFMCVCILDETSEVAKFIYDTGDDVYEVLPFRSLEREDKGNDYRKIVNLMSKMR